MQKIIKISRPRFWIYTVGPLLLAVAATYGAYHIPWLQIGLFFIYFSFPANIFIYGINDLYDRDTDTLNIKKQNYEHVLKTQDDILLKKIIAYTTIPFCVYTYIVASTPALKIFILFLFFSWQYSAYPIRAKSVPFLDSIFSSFIYILPGIFTYTLITHTLPNYGPMIAGFLWSYAMHVYSAVPDINADTQAHIQTGATMLGKNTTLILCGILYTGAGLIASIYIGPLSVIGIGIYLYLVYISIRKKGPEEVLSVYKYFPLINTLVGAGIFFILLYQHIF